MYCKRIDNIDMICSTIGRSISTPPAHPLSLLLLLLRPSLAHTPSKREERREFAHNDPGGESIIAAAVVYGHSEKDPVQRPNASSGTAAARAASLDCGPSRHCTPLGASPAPLRSRPRPLSQTARKPCECKPRGLPYQARSSLPRKLPVFVWFVGIRSFRAVRTKQNFVLKKSKMKK